MNKYNSKFFIVIGILLIIVGLILFPNEGLIASIGILLGVNNLVKGIRLSRGIKPYIVRKQEERERRIDEELQQKMRENKNKLDKNN